MERKTEDFESFETVLYANAMTGPCHYTFVETHTMYTNSEP